MGAASKGFTVAADILVACALITLAIAGTRIANKTQQIASENLNRDTVQYMESDISMLLSNLHSGDQVKKYVEKYRHKMSVEVQTLKSSHYNAQPIRYNATTPVVELTDSDSDYYVTADAMFKCEGDRDSNGVFVNLRFIQKGAFVPENNSNIGTPAEAHASLASSLGLPQTSSWQDICNKVSMMSNGDQQAKHQLVESLGASSVTDSSTWTAVTNATVDILNSYKTIIQNSSAVPHHKDTKILQYNESWEVDFTPEVLLVVRTANASVTTHCWVNGKWITDPINITISGKTITHSDSLNSSDTITVTAYN